MALCCISVRSTTTNALPSFPTDESIAFASRALLSLRVINNLTLAEDTLKRSVINVLLDDRFKRQVTPVTKAILALEIEGYFRDHGMLSCANKWLSLSRNILARRSSITAVPASLVRMSHSRLLQHRAMINVSAGNYKVAAEYFRRWEDVHDRASWRHGLTNAALYRAEWLYKTREYDEALDVVRQCERKYGSIFMEHIPGGATEAPPAYTKWTFAELTRVYPIFASRKGGDQIRRRLLSLCAKDDRNMKEII
jgi:hypothetical protein